MKAVMKVQMIDISLGFFLFKKYWGIVRHTMLSVANRTMCNLRNEYRTEAIFADIQTGWQKAADCAVFQLEMQLSKWLAFVI